MPSGRSRIIAKKIDARLARLHLRVPWVSQPTFPDRATPPSTDECIRLASRCRDILSGNLLPFFLRSVDSAQAGYLEDAEGTEFYDRGDRTLCMQSRQLWFFSSAAREGYGGDAATAAAHQGFRYIEKRFWDPLHGGYFNQISSGGTPIDDRKDAMWQGFVVFAYTAYAEVFRDQTAAQAAIDLFELLETKALDPAEGAYHPLMERDWTPCGSTGPKSSQPAPKQREFGVELHNMEALTALYRLAPTDRLRNRLEVLIFRNITAFEHPSLPATINSWVSTTINTAQVQSNLLAHHGHDIEAAWLVLDALRALGLPASTLRYWAQRRVNYVVQRGYDRRNGGVFTNGPFSGWPRPWELRDKIWWTQAEAMVSFLEIYQLTGRAGYFDAFRRTLAFTERHILAPGGGWYSAVSADGRRIVDAARATRWHGGYHSGRSMMRCANLLAAIAKGGEVAAKPAREGSGSSGA